ncbi:MAG: PAS domain-containing protein [Opitutae bacterium]|nr:PAS domain-containing protein [Opitutae bacterium]
MINIVANPFGLLLKASFRVKVAIYTFATTVIALFIAAIAFLWLLNLSMKNIVTVDLRGTTDQLNTSCAASIRFGDEITGAEYLNHGGNQQVLSATLYLPDGSLFAHYDREEQSAPEFPGQTDGEVHFEWNRASILRPMQENGELIGFLYMVRDLGEIYERYFTFAWLFLGLLFAVLALTLLSTTWLHGFLRKPIQELAHAASKVDPEKGYSIRAKKVGEDELGTLTDVFNEMMDRIQSHEMDMRHSQERLRQVINLVPHMIFAKDRDGRLVLANQSMADTLGIPVEQLIDSTASKWYSREEYQKIRSHDIEVFKTDRPHFSEEVLIDHEGNQIRLQTTKIPFVQSGTSHNVLLGISIDVTRAKLAEEALRNSNDELDLRVKERTSELREAVARMERQERLALVGRVSGNIAHELRNPLGAIRQSIYYLNMIFETEDFDVKNLKMIRKHMGMIESEVDASNHVITNLLGTTQVDRQRKKEKTDLSDVIQVSVQRVWVDEWAKLNMDVDSILVWGDFLQLRQLMINLLENAKTAVKNQSDATIWIDTKFDGQSAFIHITDNGSGMSEETLTRLFEPLYTTNPQGSGLGLSICQEIVEERHGGTIQFESQEGTGTQVKVTLPLFSPQEERPLGKENLHTESFADL